MENSSPLILDISSDEESGFGDSRKGSGHDFGGGVFGDGEDCNWLSKLLDEVGGKINDDDDDDDVVVLSEVFPNPSKKSRSDSLKPSAKVVGYDDGGDDDCVVLDGDPDKPAVLVNSRVDVDDDDSDDLEIVGEKGEVACRDFPHPRHLCAKFLFASTPHEVHCGQCHCYVCDSLAPCPHWGSGASSIDHCHASDKEEYWKAERKHVKKGGKPAPVISTTSGSPLLEAFFPTTQVPVLAQPQPNSLAQKRCFNPVTIRSCSLSSNVSVPNAVNHPPGYAVPRCRPQSRIPSLQSHPTSDNYVALVSRDKSYHGGSHCPQSFPPPAVFKRHGQIGASPNNKHAYGSPLSRDPSLKRCRTFQTPVFSGRCVSNQQKVGNHTPDPVIPQPRLSSSQTMNVRRANYLPSQSRSHSLPYSSSLSQDPIQCQSQTPAQPYATRNFPGAAAPQPNISSQPSAENVRNLVVPQPHIFLPDSPAPFQAVASYQSDAGNDFGNQLHSGSMISSHRNTGNNLESHSSEPQAHNNSTSLSIDGLNDVFQRGNQAQNGIDASPRDSSFFPDSSVNNGNLQIHAEESQCQSVAPAETSHLQNVPKNDHHPSIASVDNFLRKSEVLADYTSQINDADCQFPESTGPGSLDFQFDNWMFENPSLSGAVEVSVSPNWNMFSPEPAFMDSGTLFDI